eukprot:7989775-Alexandrium_andersonii.AAC.1
MARPRSPAVRTGCYCARSGRGPGPSGSSTPEFAPDLAPGGSRSEIVRAGDRAPRQRQPGRQPLVHGMGRDQCPEDSP